MKSGMPSSLASFSSDMSPTIVSMELTTPPVVAAAVDTGLAPDVVVTVGALAVDVVVTVGVTLLVLRDLVDPVDVATVVGLLEVPARVVVTSLTVSVVDAIAILSPG